LSAFCIHQAYEQRYGEAVSRHFYRLADRPNVFTDPLPF
jgi:hypothetical protein